MLRFLACVLVSCLAACASSSRPASSADANAPAGPSQSVRLAVTDFRTAATFELVSESHTGYLEQYSTVRNDASRKVQDDEVMTALRAYMRERGYDRYARSGRAPALERGAKAWVLEADGPDGPTHALVTPSTSGDELQTLREIREVVLEAYNRTQGWQAVEVKDGQLPFKKPEFPGQKKP